MDDRSPEQYAKDLSRSLGLCSECGTPKKSTVPVNLDLMSNVPSLNMKVVPDKLSETLSYDEVENLPLTAEIIELAIVRLTQGRLTYAAIMKGGRDLDEQEAESILRRALQASMQAINKRDLQLKLLLEPQDAEHVGTELQWLLKQGDSIGIVAFQLVKAFAQKNAAFETLADFPQALAWLNPTERKAYATGIIIDADIIRCPKADDYPCGTAPLTPPRCKRECKESRMLITDEAQTRIQEMFPHYEIR